MGGLKRSLFWQVCEAEGTVVPAHKVYGAGSSSERWTRVVLLILLCEAIQIFEGTSQST